MRNSGISGSSKVCVLILNYQSFQETIDYVAILRRQKDVQLRILIVDNCSPNGSYEELVASFRDEDDIEVVRSERNGGYAYGNNYGLRHLINSDIDYVVISNNDIVIDDDHLLSKLVREYGQLRNPAFVSPLMHTAGLPARYPAWRLPTLQDDLIGSLRCFQVAFGDRNAYDSLSGRGTIEVDCLPGSFFMGKKEIFFQIGLFDDNTFLYMEEAILACKTKQFGLQNYLVTSLAYEHTVSKTISSHLSLTTMRRHLINSRIYYHEKYLLTKPAGIAILRLLFHVWRLENFFYLLARGAVPKKNAKNTLSARNSL